MKTMLIEDPYATYKALYRYVNRAFDGGCAFGLDMRTVRIAFPRIAATMTECLRLMA